MYLVTYDLNKPGSNYNNLFEAIKGLGECWHSLDSVWLLKTGLTEGQIYDRIRPHLDANDKLLIIKVYPDRAYGWLPKDAWSWIQARQYVL